MVPDLSQDSAAGDHLAAESVSDTSFIEKIQSRYDLAIYMNTILSVMVFSNHGLF